MIDHDRLFKELLCTFFREFVEAFLPEVGTYLEADSLVFLDKEVFTDVTVGERHEADLVVRGRFRGQEAFFLIHLEHQARSETEFGRRMFRYFARLYEAHGLPVYPVVLFSHDVRRREPDRHVVRFPDREVLSFRYRVIQLRRLGWRRFVRTRNPAACALMSKMAIVERDRPRVMLECLRLLVTLRLDPARTRLISGFVETYLKLNAAETLQFDAETRRVLPESERTKVMEITTSWKEEGRQEGRQEGLLVAAREDIVEVLEARFGAVPPEVGEKLAVIQDPTRLKSLLRLASTAESIRDFLDAGWG